MQGVLCASGEAKVMNESERLGAVSLLYKLVPVAGGGGGPVNSCACRHVPHSVVSWSWHPAAWATQTSLAS